MGAECSENRVARQMQIEAIQGVKATYWTRTTFADPSKIASPNRLDRYFTATRPNEKWVSDITYVRTREGWLYLAVIIDLFSRKVVAHRTSSRMTADLVTNTLEAALHVRRPGRDLLHHSDRGSQYTSDEHVRILRRRGITISMSRSGECYDNAVAESFFATLKTEMIHRRRFATRSEATSAIFRYIETFYNRERLHSTLDYVSPAQFELLHHQPMAA